MQPLFTRKKLFFLLTLISSSLITLAQIKVIEKKTVPVAPNTTTIGQPQVRTANLKTLTTKDIDFPNWNFEQGLSGWSTEGTAFNNQPTFGYNIVTQRILYKMEYNQNGIGGDYWKDQGMNPGYNGSYWIGTYENNPKGATQMFQTQGDQPVGVLISPEIIITTSYCYFLIGGGADPQRLYVEFQTKQADGSWRTEITKSAFRSNEMMYRERMDIAAHINKTARIRIVDNSGGGWGHINVDNFRFTNTPIPGISLRDEATGRQYEVDEDSPVWGIADTHAHPTHQEGFGGTMIAGKPNTPLSVTYSNEVCNNIHGAAKKPFILGADDHFTDGWPNLIAFPKFTSKTHQQQHVEFLKRAWQGGLRIYCALTVNNMFVASRFLGPGNDGTAFDDESAIKRQLAATKQMVNENSQWMEIATSPKDARRIILNGKLAVVLGIESDNLGNFKAPSYNWDDNVGANNRPLVPITEANADQLLEAKLQEYYTDGVRQITPIHYISGLFGGAAVFRGELAGIQMTFNNTINVKSGINKRIPFSVMNDYSVLVLASNPLLTNVGYAQRIISQDANTNISTINALRMTPIGTKLINKMMTKGFIIDSEHMGYDTKDDLFAQAAVRNYPIISSHTDPAGLSYNWLGSPVAFRNGDHRFNQDNFGTSNVRNIANEFQLSDDNYNKITRSGGTVGVFMLPYLKKPYTGTLGSVTNDCAGTSKTFAQMYLYSIDKMDFRGVALCTDRGMTDFIGPRFGPNSAYALKDEKLPELKVAERQRQRLAQTNGVRYDNLMRSYHPSWYENYETSIVDIVVPYFEEDVWKALAANEAGYNRNSIPAGRELTKELRVKNFIEGLQINAIEDPGIFTFHWFEKAAMFCIRTGRSVQTLPRYNSWLLGDQNFVISTYNQILPIWRTWNARTGNNQPLRRYQTGNRAWDFNTDGMAHYGLMPDFLQDLRNIGLRPTLLSFLFNSAEDYIKMWEKTVKASGPR